jgi:hypothetical protein
MSLGKCRRDWAMAVAQDAVFLARLDLEAHFIRYSELE